MINLLPPPEHYQYFSHLFHGKSLIPYATYRPDPNWGYSEYELSRFQMIFGTDPDYIKDRSILDLGCHDGFFSYVARYMGAKKVLGVNVRKFPLDVANFAFSQLGMTNYQFIQWDIEDLEFLQSISKTADTVILTLALEHLKNPYAVLETISNSTVKKLIFESSVFSDEGPAALQYYSQSTESDFTVYDPVKCSSIGAVPNTEWIEMMLYHFGWKIEHYKLEHKFNKNWFATPGLTKFTPRSHKTLAVLCTRFGDTHGNNFEN